jgi:hypothetical protein
MLASDHGSGPATSEIIVYDAPPGRLYDPNLP